MEVKAKARYVRMSPPKVRLVADLVRGMQVDDALTQLRFHKKAAAKPVKKLIESAIANAEHNFSLNRSGLRIKTIAADDGPTYKRWKPRAYGRATPIRKRTTHLSIVLDNETDEKDANQASAETQSKSVQKEKQTEEKTEQPTKKQDNEVSDAKNASDSEE